MTTKSKIKGCKAWAIVDSRGKITCINKSKEGCWKDKNYYKDWWDSLTNKSANFEETFHAIRVSVTPCK